MSSLAVAIDRGDLNRARYFLLHGSDPNEDDYTQDLPLHLAALKDNVAMIELVLEHGADIDVLDGEGNSALHLALQFHDDSAARFLIQAGADVNTINEDGDTPLHEAGHIAPELVLELLQAGADPTVRDFKSRRPSEMVGNERVSKLLREYEELWERGWSPERHHLMQEQERLERLALINTLRHRRPDLPFLPPEIVYSALEY